MTEGVLDIRGDAAPAPMASPTTISGTNDGGQITAGTLSTPTVSFSQQITSPVATRVDIDATFGLVTPNSLRGAIDEDRNVRLTASLRVELEIRVDILRDQVFRCVASPVALVLGGNHDGHSVRLRTPNFSVPAVSTTGDCPTLISDGVNGQLQGAGHSLELLMSGDLTAPLAPGEESSTVLTVSPDGSASAGQPVTLTATVSPGASASGSTIPQGLVEFRDGGVTVGSVDTDEHGVAMLTLASLQGGRRSLTAHYLGSAPIYAPSASQVLYFTVEAAPIVAVDLPAAIQVGGYIDFDVLVDNSGFGGDIDAGRLDVQMRREFGSGAIGPVAGIPRVSLYLMDREEPLPVTLNHSGSGLNQRIQGFIDPADGQLYSKDSTRQLRLRLQIASNTAVGPLQVDIIMVDVLGQNIVAESGAVIDMVNESRQAVSITAGSNFPAYPAVTPARVRAGGIVNLYQTNLVPVLTDRPATGFFEFHIDGRQVFGRDPSGASEEAWVRKVPFIGRTTFVLRVPTDVGPGQHTLSARYSGDQYYTPVAASFTVVIEPQIAPVYECRNSGSLLGATTIQLDGRSLLPRVATPPAAALSNSTLSMRLSRVASDVLLTQPILADDQLDVAVEFASGGTAYSSSIDIANGTAMLSDQPNEVDLIVAFNDLTGMVSVDGPFGSEIDASISSITIEYQSQLSGLKPINTLRCLPKDEMLSFGKVTVAGVNLSTPTAVTAGHATILEAEALPGGAGSIIFYANGSVVGHVATADGTARVWTDDLPQGDVEVVAIYYPTGIGPVVTSAPAQIRVIGSCLPAEPGSGAIVRLVYMQLLGRCPDAAGYAYWVGQLDGGLSPETFAQRISASLEARKVIVADAYRLLLDRAPDASGATFWAERLGRNARYDDLLASIAASPEFRSRAGGTDTGVVSRLYERIIGRAPDTAGRDYWVGVLRTRGTTQVVRSFVNLPEPLAAIVTGSYEDVLGRTPTAEELTAGADALRASGDRSALYASIIATDDFADRAQTFPELV